MILVCGLSNSSNCDDWSLKVVPVLQAFLSVIFCSCGTLLLSLSFSYVVTFYAHFIIYKSSVFSFFVQVLPQLEQFNKVILWFGGDSRKWQSARHFARKLNEKRCFLIR